MKRICRENFIRVYREFYHVSCRFVFQICLTKKLFISFSAQSALESGGYFGKGIILEVPSRNLKEEIWSLFDIVLLL